MDDNKCSCCFQIKQPESIDHAVARVVVPTAACTCRDDGGGGGGGGECSCEAMVMHTGRCRSPRLHQWLASTGTTSAPQGQEEQPFGQLPPQVSAGAVALAGAGARSEASPRNTNAW
jgi:hypothetical protein